MRLQQVHRSLHRPGGNEHFGDKLLANFKQTTDFTHSRNTGLLQDLVGRDTFIQGSLRVSRRGFGISL